ncbi:hypothetical protein GO285_01479 [Ralstonia solanacearum]|nr:hypothetical protein [Ralstonia solanacearum]NKG09680.1 hypothetical protein [Ralstonia solanacearum]
MMGMVRHRHALPFNNVFQVKKPIMDDSRLARYLGFSQAVHLQHVLAPEELTVPYVVYWDHEVPTPVPYPATTQAEAVEHARAARAQHREGTGWSSGREGWLDLGNGTKAEVLLIEGWVPGLEAPLEMFVYYRREPFRLVQGFLWKDHPQARQDRAAFAAEFKRGILMQPFGEQCLQCVEQAEPFGDGSTGSR